MSLKIIEVIRMIKLDYSGVDKEYLKSGLNVNTIASTARAKNISKIYGKKVSVMLDFLDLPNMSEEELSRIERVGKDISKKNKNLVVLGIGGSALGVSFLEHTFVSSIHKKTKTKVYVCDNIDGDSFVSLLDSLDLKKTAFNVITKSGGTSETMTQMLIVLDRLKKKKLDISKKVVVTTTENNNLHNFAKSMGMETFLIPVGVGGRFSVLSPVGLLPAVVMGVDIRGLLSGARSMLENGKLNEAKNLAYTCAYINNYYLKKGMTSLVTMPYSDRLKLFPDFFAQLWAESLGKRYDRNGVEVFAGQNPIKTVGVTDQHSQLQLYSEGPKDKVIMFITVGESKYDACVTEDYGIAKHLNSVSLKKLLDYEYQSTAYSLTSLDRPNYRIHLDKICEESIGALIMMCELMTAYMGEFLNINAFDQPGVELSKIYTKACLKVKGYEVERKEIKNFADSKKIFSL